MFDLITRNTWSGHVHAFCFLLKAMCVTVYAGVSF